MNRTPWSLHANSPNTVVAADGTIVAFFPNAKDADMVIAWSRMGDLVEREELQEENLRLEKELGEADEKITTLSAKITAASAALEE